MNLDTYLHQYGLTLEAIAGVLDLDSNDVAYVSGSVTDSLGDAQSDLDVFVLTSMVRFEDHMPGFSREREVEQQRLGFGIMYKDVAGTCFDVEYHLREKVEELLAALAALEPTDRDGLWRSFRSLGRFERAEAVDCLHRFRIGVPVANLDAFERLRGQFDERRFLLWNAHFHLIESEDYAKGTQRSLGGGDPENAYLKLMRL
jgi:hypothetical protein